MSIESIVEAFARGLAQGFVTVSALQQEPPRKATRRRKRRAPVGHGPAVTVEQPPSSSFDAPGPVTQAELDRMEAALRGEVPADKYIPGEGVAPWQGS